MLHVSCCTFVLLLFSASGFTDCQAATEDHQGENRGGSASSHTAGGHPQAAFLLAAARLIPDYPRGPNNQKNFNLAQNLHSRSKFLILLEIFNLGVSISPPKNRAAVGGSLENFILARNFQSRSKSRLVFDLWALWDHWGQNYWNIGVFAWGNYPVLVFLRALRGRNRRKDPKRNGPW